MVTETDTIDLLFLELSQFTKATTRKELELQDALREANDICRSMHSIAERAGRKTNWVAFHAKLTKVLKAQHKILFPSPPSPLHGQPSGSNE